MIRKIVKWLIVVIVFMLIVVTIAFIRSCNDCEWDEDDLVLTEAELAHFSSFEVGEIITYSSNYGETDSIMISEISTDDENPDVDCFPWKIRPRNYKGVSINYLPVDYFTKENNAGNAEPVVRYFLTMTKYLAPSETFLNIEFKSFFYISSEFEQCYNPGDTIINGKVISSYYSFYHSNPEHVNEPTDIYQIIWTHNEGLVAYVDKREHVWMQN